jgi:hypothetical protein
MTGFPWRRRGKNIYKIRNGSPKLIFKMGSVRKARRKMENLKKKYFMWEYKPPEDRNDS